MWLLFQKVCQYLWKFPTLCWRQWWDLPGWVFGVDVWLSVQRACTGSCPDSPCAGGRSGRDAAQGGTSASCQPGGQSCPLSLTCRGLSGWGACDHSRWSSMRWVQAPLSSQHPERGCCCCCWHHKAWRNRLELRAAVLSWISGGERRGRCVYVHLHAYSAAALKKLHHIISSLDAAHPDAAFCSLGLCFLSISKTRGSTSAGTPGYCLTLVVATWASSDVNNNNNTHYGCQFPGKMEWSIRTKVQHSPPVLQVVQSSAKLSSLLSKQLLA